jgi:hypothetical protein
MLSDCDMRLTSLGPIVEVILRLEWTPHGWAMWVRHRHAQGLFVDCPPAEYTRLSLAELQDVFAASAFTWGPLGEELRRSDEIG